MRIRASSSVRYSIIRACSATKAFQDLGIPGTDTGGRFFNSPLMSAACGHLVDRSDRRLLAADPVLLGKKCQKTLVLFT